MALGHEIEVSFSGREDWEGAFAVEIIEKCMADREDGQRGFLITGKEEFLEKYSAGEQKKLPEYFAPDCEPSFPKGVAAMSCRER